MRIPRLRWVARGRVIVSESDLAPRIMGIVNLDPGSFSDGGRVVTPDQAAARARQLEAEGADLIDVGGESTRPGSSGITLEEELRRVEPAIAAIAAAIRAPISVDTSKAEVAARALAAGACVINDVTALGDPRMAEVAAEYQAGVVLMHMQGSPRDMQTNPHYGDVTAEVAAMLAERIDRAAAAGVPRENLAIDPGFGFGKTLEHNLMLLRNLERLATLGAVLLVGLSRKSMIGTITGREPGERTAGSVAAALVAAERGARVVRVHDVAPTRHAIRVYSALGCWENES